MVRKTFNRPKGVHQPFSQYSHSVVVEGASKFIFCAGQVASRRARVPALH
jgi:2-iminobutanoate/2-iminopropanoate deaminase